MRVLFLRILFPVLILAPAGVTRGQDVWTALAVHSAQELAMGGCFAANSHWVSAPLFNPAQGPERPNGKGVHISLLLNPLPLLQRPRIDVSDGDPLGWLLPAGLLVQQVRIGWQRFSLALLPVAERLDRRDAPWRSAPSEPWDSAEMVTHTSLSWRLDQRVRVGLSLPWGYDPRRRKRLPGIIYGILVRPHGTLLVGMTAVDLPAGAGTFRKPGDRVGDNSLNVGVSYRWRPESRGNPLEIVLAADARNVTNEGVGYNGQELHLGGELSLWGQLFLRGGLYWPHNDFKAGAVSSLGVGLLDLNSFQPWKKRYHQPFTTCDYAFLVTPGGEKHHYLTLRLGF